MAASLQDHFHILDTIPEAETTTGEWTAMAPNLRPSLVPRPAVIASPMRALDGTFYAHVLQDESGPVLIKDWSGVVKCATWADVNTWMSYLGAYKYFIYNHHDPEAHAAYVQRVYVNSIEELRSPGPTTPVFYLGFTLLDASQEA